MALNIIVVILLLLASPFASAREFTQIGIAMEPTIMDGEKVEASILTALFYEPKRFDVILYRNPSGKNNLFSGRII